MKKLVIVFAAFSLALAGAQKFNIRVFQPTKLSGAELKPGDYRLELNDNRVVMKSGKQTVEATARVENSDQKFSSTTVRIVDGSIEEIRLGGTHLKLVFNR
jgi:hypothetical protein